MQLLRPYTNSTRMNVDSLPIETLIRSEYTSRRKSKKLMKKQIGSLHKANDEEVQWLKDCGVSRISGININGGRIRTNNTRPPLIYANALIILLIQHGQADTSALIRNALIDAKIGRWTNQPKCNPNVEPNGNNVPLNVNNKASQSSSSHGMSEPLVDQLHATSQVLPTRANSNYDSLDDIPAVIIPSSGIPPSFMYQSQMPSSSISTIPLSPLCNPNQSTIRAVTIPPGTASLHQHPPRHRIFAPTVTYVNAKSPSQHLPPAWRVSDRKAM